ALTRICSHTGGRKKKAKDEMLKQVQHDRLDFSHVFEMTGQKIRFLAKLEMTKINPPFSKEGTN
ncbi:MAG: hypothetical protein ACERKJ_08790, partial [Candidatus Dadabacteria bacterium]